MNTPVFLLFLLLPFMAGAQADTLRLEACYALALQHYPLGKQKVLIAASSSYSIENAAKGYLPQLSVTAQASYQSEVTRIPIDLPNGHVEGISKDQYRLQAELNQNIYDGGIIRQQQAIHKANAVVEDQKVEVELFKIKERINQLFFGILLLQDQQQLLELRKEELQRGLDRVNASIANGAALKSSARVLQAELLQANQRNIELEETKKSYLLMLGQFIHQPLHTTAILARPQSPKLSESIYRPELELFSAQKHNLQLQNKMISARTLPRLGLFLQAGYGRPALNMLNNSFEPFYIGGLRFNWTFSGLYTSKNERQLLEVGQKVVEVQQETFLFNTTLALQQQQAEIAKLQALPLTDEEIIALRGAIAETARAQLENGAITASDYLRELNAADGARQNLLLHQTQLLMAQHNYNAISGKQEFKQIIP